MGGSYSTLPAIQSYEVDVPKRSGEGRPRRAIGVTELPTEVKGNATLSTIWHVFEDACGKFAESPCIGKRVKKEDGSMPFEYITYGETLKQILIVGAGLSNLGLKPKEGVGIYSANRMEWMLAQMGGFSQNLVCVPLYDTLGESAVKYEINHAELRCVVAEKSKLASVLAVAKECPTLKFVVQIEPLDDDESSQAFKAKGVTLLDFASLTKSGSEAPKPPSPPAPDDLSYIMYTSGTTGDPKGVMLSHRAVSIAASYKAGLELFPTDRYLSWLPLAHIFETMVEVAMFASGGRVGYFQGNIKLLMDDIQALKPTIFAGVPRIFSRVYDKANAGIEAASPKLQAILKWAMANEMKAKAQGSSTTLGKLLFKKFRAALGGEVRIIISGAAPLPSHVQEFLTATMGCPVLQGYGMTENCASLTLSYTADWKAGHVGPPVPVAEMKLVDVEEMGYSSSNSPPTGEIQVRGTCMTSGYYKNEKATKEMIGADGWQATGDIGRWNPDGTLSIIDRKKNIFKLAQGEYVAAEKIEGVLAKSKYIGQCFVYGNSFFVTLVAVIVPDMEALVAWGIEKGFVPPGTGVFDADKVALAARPEAKALIMEEIKKEAANGKLKGFEIPKDVHLEGEVDAVLQGFTVAKDTMTPTFKLRRPQLLKAYKAQVDAMYTGLGEDITKQK
jgi:long-chain acyl-CoA synthetase